LSFLDRRLQPPQKVLQDLNAAALSPKVFEETSEVLPRPDKIIKDLIFIRLKVELLEQVIFSSNFVNDLIQKVQKNFFHRLKSPLLRLFKRELSNTFEESLPKRHLPS
jgi:hypothetical protein